ncbi:MAG: 16S rRNA (cytosine(1402)-N(4))-methyltransferase RsmH [Desulfuromonadaceae bacterium]|nr:16S rRNA (cytosine(1402)-N(4))-methyltransferase RsmH [Desulfuromonadaceae bacterium]
MMGDADFRHEPVLLHEVLDLLHLFPGAIVVDGTVGGGGHSQHILAATGPDGRLFGLDRDQQALTAASKRLASFGKRVTLRQANYAALADVLRAEGIDECDAILLDLGVSSHQLDCQERGFSFQHDAPLDMRMDQTEGITAEQVVNELTAAELGTIFKEYGEERWAKRIARRIERERAVAPVRTTLQLAELVKSAVPAGKQPQRIHPATRVFQALRIYVNDELGYLKKGLESSLEMLRPGGVLVVISFHSLEDRIVKQFFRAQTQTCECPPRLPVCMCTRQARVKLLTRGGIRAGSVEIEHNPRARSAILRGAEKLPQQEQGVSDA